MNLWEWPLSIWHPSDVLGNGGTHSHLLQEYGWLLSPIITSGNVPWLSTEALSLVSDFVPYFFLLGIFFPWASQPWPPFPVWIWSGPGYFTWYLFDLGTPGINKVIGFHVFFSDSAMSNKPSNNINQHFFWGALETLKPLNLMPYLKTPKLIHLCNKKWPKNPLDNSLKWPSNNSLDPNIL